MDQIWAEWGFAIRISLIVIGLIVIRSILLVLIRRVVTSVTSGVKRRAGIDDTRALDASPL
ncbi:MAG: mechanosensitive ion channel protein, partial [Actinobacteria bacterium]|nr:mechanosensitive ion channel protein [Actinomycetota bacterium]